MHMIQRISAKEEDTAAKELGQSNLKLHAMESQLQKLYQYRENYNQQFIDAGANYLSSSSIQDYLMFINNLNASIDKLLEAIGAQKKIVEQLKAVWLKKHQKVDIYNKVKENYLVEEEKIQNLKDQRLNDESSIAFFMRNQPK